MLSVGIKGVFSYMDTVKLYNGVEMPMEGFGVFQIPDNACMEVVFTGIQRGIGL